eukprot:TRINITY_DN5057_c0_g1_i1.p1 TRINITY_DN5057_c0_g1~~TRINITY_DN5057_c0_g1_i1.p1  ORF type:complete len:431 (+),score=92.75 TRINITY_DN5057_c0_g1_i1:44-1336(+)
MASATCQRLFQRVLSPRLRQTSIRLYSQHAQDHHQDVVLATALQQKDSHCNLPDAVMAKVGTNLHLQRNHPIQIVKAHVEAFFTKLQSTPASADLDSDIQLTQRLRAPFVFVDSLSPVVSTKQNFDDLLIPADHISRKPSDTFYINKNTVLRTHTSAHQSDLFTQGHKSFLCVGDVYRRDSIDATHYPIFHQLEGVCMFPSKDLQIVKGSDGTIDRERAQQIIVKDLKYCLEGLISSLFGKVEMRWVDAYFPFTEPSLELEIFYMGKWMEVLGSGMIQQPILNACGTGDHVGWAFGIGLERFAMALFDIQDIRLFWSQDSRFINQFSHGSIRYQFQPFSKYPPVRRDVSFWVPSNYTEQDFCMIIRSVAGDLIEEVAQIDSYTDKKNNRTSLCYRITYRSMERSLSNEEVNQLQDQVQKLATEQLGIVVR